MTKIRRTTIAILDDAITSMSDFMAVQKQLNDQLLSIVEQQQKALAILQKVVSEHKDRARKKRHYRQSLKVVVDYYKKTEDSKPYLLTKENHPANQVSSKVIHAPQEDKVKQAKIPLNPPKEDPGW